MARTDLYVMDGKSMVYFSIIVPIYKVEKYLKKCLDSIQNQSYQEFEVILVDDGSPDNAPLICDAYAESDSRFCVIHKRNEGLVRARKTGVARAKGKYIIFVDGDDWIDKQMLEQLYHTLRNDTVDIVALGFWQEFGQKKLAVSNVIKPGRYEKNELNSQVYPHMLCMGLAGNIMQFGIFPSVWSKVFNRELIVAIIDKIDDRITMGEDAACTYPCLFHANSLLILDEKFYHYRYVASSMSQKYDRRYFEKIDFLFQYFDENTYLNLGPQLQRYKIFLFLLGIRQMLMAEKSFYKNCQELALLCKQEKFNYLLFSFSCDALDFKNRKLIKQLHREKYRQVCVYYWMERKYNIFKIRNLFVKIKRISYGRYNYCKI